VSSHFLGESSGKKLRNEAGERLSFLFSYSVLLGWVRMSFDTVQRVVFTQWGQWFMIILFFNEIHYKPKAEITSNNNRSFKVIAYVNFPVGGKGEGERIKTIV
jgi:hypothetical protein